MAPLFWIIETANKSWYNEMCINGKFLYKMFIYYPEESLLSSWRVLPWREWAPTSWCWRRRQSPTLWSSCLTPVVCCVWLDPSQYSPPSLAAVVPSGRTYALSEWWVCTFRDTVFTSCTHTPCLAGSIIQFSPTFPGCGGLLKENLCFLRVVNMHI